METTMDSVMKTSLLDENEITAGTDLINLIVQHDGSSTRLLESLFDEKIDVECLGQGYNPVSHNEWDDIEEREEVLVRAVFLRGRQSGNRYLYASSYIRAEFLDEEIVQLLLDKEKGIGEIIREYKLETYREFMASKPVYNNIIRSVFASEKHITSKVYKIYMKGTPVMLISEYYPHSVYDDVM